MMAGVTTSIQPVEVHSTAARLSFVELARVEVLCAAGVRVGVVARRLGRDPSTIYRELERNRDSDGGYDAAVAQRLAGTWALRSKDGETRRGSCSGCDGERATVDALIAACDQRGPALRGPHGPRGDDLCGLL